MASMLITCLPAISQSIDEAAAVRKSGDLKTAFEMYEKLAHQGNSEAQFNVGFFYETGQVVPQSYANAEIWYKKSALQNYAKAQSSLAWLYANDKPGVNKDVVQAAIWYERASAGGTAPTASMYINTLWLYGNNELFLIALCGFETSCNDIKN